jgi:predicted RNase H-like HicB family nuclease
VFFRHEANGAYTAHIPALELITEGRTLKEAKEMARDAIAGWIEAAEQIGKPIPDDLPMERVEVG